MQGLLAKLNQQKNPNLGSKGASRSTSIASSIDDLESNSDEQESETQQKSNTLKPKVRKEKKDDKKPQGWNSGGTTKEVKPKVTSRINTNMVKLKLLDATRKAIIEKTKKQLVSSYAQTDSFKTKLCKDQSVENQNDLINAVDESTETDMELIASRAKDGTLIVTSTCAVNTEIFTQNVFTQTVMPRSNISFKRFLDSKHTVQYADEEEWTNDEETDDPSKEIIKIERRLKSKKKLARQRSPHKSNIDILIEDETSDIIETIPTDPQLSEQINSESEFEDSIKDDHQPDVIKESVKRTKPTDATFNSWHDLDFPEPKLELPRSFTDGPTPWSNFQDLVLGQRFLNARLSPVPQRYARTTTKQVTWSDSQVKVVSELIHEASALIEMFDQVAMLLGPDIKLHNVSDVEDFILPPTKYANEMNNYCDKLEASLKRLHGIKPLTEKRTTEDNVA